MIEFVIGSGLAASAGLNAWMPLFLLGLADRLIPAVQLPSGWSWLSGDITLGVMGALLVLEIIADKIPVLDSVNDIVQSVLRPASGGIAFGAGAGARTIAMDDPAVMFTDSAWLPILSGVLIALAVHVVKALGRLAANAVTGGLAAPVISTVEDGASLLLAVTAIVVPLLALVLLAGLVAAAVVILRRRRANRSAPAASA